MLLLKRNCTIAGVGLLFAGCVTAPALAGDSWDITTVDSTADVGDHSSIAILPSGHPAISYFDLENLNLKYAWRDDQGWNNTTIDAGEHIGVYTSLVILPSGNPAISYHDVDREDLKYAWFDGETWQTTIVDGAFAGPTGTSLAVLPSGQPAISYRDHFNGWLKYAWFDGETWSNTVVDDNGNVGHQSSLAVLPSGQPAISYIDTTLDRLMFASFDGKAWNTTPATQPGGTNTRLAILPSGQPAIIHDASGGIQYVSTDGETWSSSPVDTVEGFESWFGYVGFAIDPSGLPSLAYVRRQFPNSPRLFYARLEDGSWNTTVVTVGGSAASSLAFLSTGLPAISFRDNNSLKFATPTVAAADLTSCSVTFGSTDNLPCDVTNFADDDDVDQILRSQFGFSAFERNLVEIVISGNSPSATTMFAIGTRDGSDTTNVVAKVKARNYATNSIDDIAQYDVSFPGDDTPHVTPVNSADYVDADSDIEVLLRYVAPATFTPLGFTVGLDQVEVIVGQS